MKDKYPCGSVPNPGQRWKRDTNREKRPKQSGFGSQTSMSCPLSPSAVIACRADVLAPSERRTRMLPLDDIAEAPAQTSIRQDRGSAPDGGALDLEKMPLSDAPFRRIKLTDRA